MHAWLNNYKVFLTHAKDTRRIYPVQDDAPIQYVKEQDQIFFRLRIKSDLLLRGEDYEWLLAIENGPERCLPITVEVKRIQPGAADYPTYKGTCYLNKGATIDRDRCEITMKVEAEDNYSRLKTVWNNIVNVLDGATKVCVNTNFKDLPSPVSIFQIQDTEQFFSFPLVDDELPAAISPPGSGWVMLTDECRVQDPFVFSVIRNIRWIREQAPTNPGGEAPGGWIETGANYVRVCESFRDRSRDYSNVGFYTLTDEVGNEYAYAFEEYRHYYVHIPYQVPQLCNGVDISECLDKLLDGTSISYRSNFFNINPDGSNPVNAQYSGIYNRVIVFQRTDILVPGADTPARVFKMTLKGFLEQLAQYQVFHAMDGNTLILEHESYFEDREGVDLTVAQPVALRGLNTYSYEDAGKVAREEWQHESDGQVQFAFSKLTFDYAVDGNCIDEAEDAETHSYDKTCNDVQSMIANPTDFTSNQTNMTFVNTWEYEGEVMIDLRDGVLNYRQTPQFLGELLWLHKRPFPVAAVATPVMEPDEDPLPALPIVHALSVKRYKKQVPVSIHLRLLENFDPLKLQKTQMGWGEVIEAEYSLKSGKLTFTPLHL